MPFITLVIAPLLALYLKFKLVQFGVKIVLFTALYLLFKEGMQFVIDTIFGKMLALDFPCFASYVLNSLDVFPMINFGLSLWGTIYTGRFLMNSMQRLI